MKSFLGLAGGQAVIEKDETSSRRNAVGPVT